MSYDNHNSTYNDSFFYLWPTCTFLLGIMHLNPVFLNLEVQEEGCMPHLACMPNIYTTYDLLLYLRWIYHLLFSYITLYRFDIPPFDFRVEGVTSISCDTHKVWNMHMLSYSHWLFTRWICHFVLHLIFCTKCTLVIDCRWGCCHAGLSRTQQPSRLGAKWQLKQAASCNFKVHLAQIISFVTTCGSLKQSANLWIWISLQNLL